MEEQLDEQVLRALRAAPAEGMDAHQIAKVVIGPKGTKNDVNQTLYKLAKECRVERMGAEGARPRWTPVADPEEKIKSTQNKLAEDILAALAHGPADGMDALQIAKAVIGPKGTQREVNPALYQLFEEGRVCKSVAPDRARPRWKAGL